MTDVEGRASRDAGSSDAQHERRCSALRGLGAAAAQQYERQGSFSLADGFEDFEEFVLDFDDYDLLESIHSHLEAPQEPSRESKPPSFPFVWRENFQNQQEPWRISTVDEMPT